MKFICLGFHDETKFTEMTPEDAQKMMDVCFAYDDELRRGGHFLGGEALHLSTSAVTVRARDGEVEAVDGPFAETKEMLGGILLLEARDREQAILLMSKHPAVKMGSIFEIRPANEEVNRLVAERCAAVSSDV